MLFLFSPFWISTDHGSYLPLIYGKEQLLDYAKHLLCVPLKEVSYTSMSLEGHQSDKLPTFIHWLNYSFKIRLVSSVYFAGCFQLSWLIKSGWQITGWEGCQCFCTLP